MNRFYSALLAASALVPSAAYAATEPKPGEIIGYFLPKTNAKIVITQRLTACPSGKKPEVATLTTIIPEGVADRFIQIDARSQLLADRTVKITTRPNGTIETFNAKTEGKGGAVLGAVAKLAFSLAGMAVGVPLKPQRIGDPPANREFACNKAVEGLLSKLSEKSKQIAEVENRIAAKGAAEADLAFLERLQGQAGKLRAALTLATEATFDPEAKALHIKNVQFDRWFDNIPTDMDLLGKHGFLVTADPDKALLDIVKAKNQTITTAATTDLIYRRPIPVTIAVMPCTAAADIGGCRSDSNDPNVQDMTTKTVVAAAQYSRDFSLRVGKGGIFGSKQAVAKFDEFGMPIELEYGTTSGADDMSALVGAATDGAKTLHDAELSELERQIKIETARQDLAKLRDPESGDD